MGYCPGPTPAGRNLRHAARMLAAIAGFGAAASPGVILVLRLAELAEAVIELREAQRHAAQADAARRAAEQLRAAHKRFAEPPPGSNQDRPRSAARLAQVAFPVPPGRFQQQSPQTSASPPAQPRQRPARMPRGPTR
jgi:hypothetical protein